MSHSHTQQVLEALETALEASQEQVKAARERLMQLADKARTLRQAQLSGMVCLFCAQQVAAIITIAGMSRSEHARCSQLTMAAAPESAARSKAGRRSILVRPQPGTGNWYVKLLELGDRGVAEQARGEDKSGWLTEVAFPCGRHESTLRLYACARERGACVWGGEYFRVRVKGLCP